MKVVIILHGTLLPNRDHDDASRSIQIECALGTKVGTLLSLLGISNPEGCVVAMNHRAARAEDEVIDGATLSVFRIVSGG